MLAEKFTRGNWTTLSAWYLVAVLMLVYTVSFIDRQIIALLVDPIKADLNISDTQISLLQGFAFAVFYSFLGIPIAHLADHSNRRNLIIAGITTWSFMTAACGFAKNFWFLFAARVGVGVGEASLSPAAHSMISDTFPKERLSKALSVYSIGIVAGSGLAYVLGGLVIEYAAKSSMTTLPLLGEIRPWQLVFIIVGILSLPFAILLITVKEPGRHGIKHSITAQNQTLKSFLRENLRLMIFYMFAFSLTSLATYSFLAWMPTVLIREYAWSAGQTGVYFGVLILVFGPAGTLCGGALSDYLLKRNITDATLCIGLLAATGIALISATTILIYDVTSELIQVAVMIFFLMLPIGIIPSGLHIISPNHLRARMSALSLFFANIIGLGLGPTCVALLADSALFGEASLGIALDAVTGVAAATGFVLLWHCRKPYQSRYAQMHS